jgi:hypothetical protein
MTWQSQESSESGSTPTEGYPRKNTLGLKGFRTQFSAATPVSFAFLRDLADSCLIDGASLVST